MIQIKAINYMGESLELSPDKYAIRKVSGLSPQGGTISTQKMAQHGTEFISATTDERNIVIDLKVVGDVEANREALYQIFPPSMPVTLEITTSRTASIVGYVESCEVDFFRMVAVGQISIICPDPFFKGAEAVFNGTSAGVGIVSSCPFESGYTVTVEFSGAAEAFTLANSTTGEILTITRAFSAGDILIIDTAERTVYINGVNAYNDKSGGWPLLIIGENQITTSHPATIKFTDRYIGL